MYTYKYKKTISTTRYETRSSRKLLKALKVSKSEKSRVATSCLYMRFPHSIAFFQVITLVGLIKVSKGKTQCSVENACVGGICQLALTSLTKQFTTVFPLNA